MSGAVGQRKQKQFSQNVTGNYLRRNLSTLMNVGGVAMCPCIGGFYH